MHVFPNTGVESITFTIKDILLIRCLDTNVMRGQTYLLYRDICHVQLNIKGINPASVTSERAFSFVWDIHEIINSSPRWLAIFKTISTALPVTPIIGSHCSGPLDGQPKKFHLIITKKSKTKKSRNGHTGVMQKSTKHLQALLTHFSALFRLKVFDKLFSPADEVTRVLHFTDISAEKVESAVQLLQKPDIN